jgi:hypothetical protein
MSERVPRMIPTDQDYVTSAEQQAKVAAFRGKWCLGAQSRQCSMRVNFIDQGQLLRRGLVHSAAIASPLIPLAVPIPFRTVVTTASSCGRLRQPEIS